MTEAVIAVKFDASAREVTVDATVVLASSDKPAFTVISYETTLFLMPVTVTTDPSEKSEPINDVIAAMK